ncbi:MAG TPA: hypothetical protein VMV10_11330, partial [Pirellulales bacterium]|nr:hypothetical protein [Pirellulales bacterium]
GLARSAKSTILPDSTAAFETIRIQAICRDFSDDDSPPHRPKDEIEEPALPEMRLQAESAQKALQEVRSEAVSRDPRSPSPSGRGPG